MPAKTKTTKSNDTPQFFRLNIEVGDLNKAVDFYTKLLDVQGRKQPGSRVYFDCGPITLQVVDVSSVGKPHTAAKALYFTVKDLEADSNAAKELGWSGRGASDRSMPWIRGEIRSASWKRERFIPDRAT